MSHKKKTANDIAFLTIRYADDLPINYPIGFIFATLFES